MDQKWGNSASHPAGKRRPNLVVIVSWPLGHITSTSLLCLPGAGVWTSHFISLHFTWVLHLCCGEEPDPELTGLLWALQNCWYGEQLSSRSIDVKFLPSLLQPEKCKMQTGKPPSSIKTIKTDSSESRTGCSGPEGALTQLCGDISRRSLKVKSEVLRHAAWVQILAAFRTEYAILGTSLYSVSFSYFIYATRVIV